MYESAEIRFIKRFLRGATNAIELGGSLGVTGSHLLNVLARDGELSSVEANPAVIPVLRHTLETHAHGRRVTVTHAAITAAPTASLTVGATTLSSRLAPDGDPVPALSLSDIAARAGAHNYALVSDIEGAEASFIYDPTTLRGCSRMVIELHGTVHDGRVVSSDEMLTALEHQGYTLLAREGDVCALER